MSDREMLEFAAKAAGLRVGFEPDGKERGRHDLYWSNVHHQLAWHGKSAGSKYPRPVFWNPLADDGDALRLAVRLNIPVFPYEDETSTGTIGVRAKNWGSKEANTRRAIVRAAAEIGRSMT
jgi:hypothetical protein